MYYKWSAKKIMFFCNFVLCLIVSLCINLTNSQAGPDPWHFGDKAPQFNDAGSLPPDLRMPMKSRVNTEIKLGIGEWFFRRILAIIVKGDHAKKNEDGSVDISLQMKFEPRQWKTLDECLKSDMPLTEDMLRRSIGYVESSIYKPTITEKITMAWTDYVQFYLIEYQAYLTWILCSLAIAGGVLWSWHHLSSKHVIIILLIIFYAYEVIISYKEAEQKELNKFLAAIDRCKWFFWQSTCEVPPPDILVFMKHMNPLKIGIRMFTSALAEPIVVISGTIETILHGVTDGLWYPLDKITYGVLTVFVNISLIYFLVMIIFNWVLNIPFGLGFGLITIGQRKRNIYSEKVNQQIGHAEVSDKISQATLDRILNVCSLALSTNNTRNNTSNVNHVLPSTRANAPSLRRSASTGRLPDFNSLENNCFALDNVRRNNIHKGSGDAH